MASNDVQSLFLNNRGLSKAMVLRNFPWIPEHLQDDAIQEGEIGLFKAAQSYDPARGTLFSTYACRSIINQVRRWYHTEKRKGLRNVGDGGKKGYLNEIPSHQSLWETANGKEDSYYDPPSQENGDLETAAADQDIINRYFRVLSPREARVLTYRFWDNMNLEEVGKILDVTRERVRQIQQTALFKLRQAMEKFRVE